MKQAQWKKKEAMAMTYRTLRTHMFKYLLYVYSDVGFSLNRFSQYDFSPCLVFEVTEAY